MRAWFQREPERGREVQFHIGGLLHEGSAQKKALAQEFRHSLSGLGCRVSVGKDTLTINAPNGSKADAAADFARRTGLAPTEIARFADSPSRADAPLLSVPGASYHVGETPPPEGFPAEWVGQTSGVQGASAVLEVLERLDGAGAAPRAVILDFDGTASRKTEHGVLVLDEALANRLVELLRRQPPVRIAFASVRGESLVPLVVDGLRKAGATEAELSRVTLYLFSGAVALPAVP